MTRHKFLRTSSRFMRGLLIAFVWQLVMYGWFYFVLRNSSLWSSK